MYQTIINWTKNDESSRKNDFVELFQLLKLDELPHDFFMTVVVQEKLIKENLVCFSSVMDTLILFHLPPEKHLQSSQGSFSQVLREHEGSHRRRTPCKTSSSATTKLVYDAARGFHGVSLNKLLAKAYYVLVRRNTVWQVILKICFFRSAYTLTTATCYAFYGLTNQTCEGSLCYGSFVRWSCSRGETLESWCCWNLPPMDNNNYCVCYCAIVCVFIL